MKKILFLLIICCSFSIIVAMKEEPGTEKSGPENLLTVLGLTEVPRLLLFTALPIIKKYPEAQISTLAIPEELKDFLKKTRLTMGYVLIKKASKGDIQAVKMLLEAGADANTQDNNGTSALTLAASRGRNDVVKLLLGNGALVNQANNKGITPLHQAAAFGNKDLVEMLIDAGASINAVDSTGMTPLMMAALRNGEEVVQLLLEKGANSNAQDKNGWTAYDWGKNEGPNNDVVQQLLTNAMIQ